MRLPGFVYAASFLLCMQAPGFLKAQALTELIKSARLHDPIYATAVAAKQSAEQGLLFAESNLGFRASFSASTFETSRVEQNTNGNITTKTDRNFTSRLAQIQIRKPLFRSREKLGVDQAAAQVQVFHYELLASEQDLLARLLVAWNDVIINRRMVALQAAAIDAWQVIIEETERGVRAGEVTLPEVELARARQAQAQALVTQAKSDLENSMQTLRQIAGPNATVPEGAELIGLEKLRPPISSELQIIEAIEQKNFEIQSHRYLEASAKLEREKNQADYKPSLDAFANLSKGDNDAVSSIKDDNRIGLQLTVPLYTSGAISSSIARADAEYRKSQSETQTLLYRVRSEALASLRNLKSISGQLSAVERTKAALDLNLTGLERGVRAGVKTRAEVASTRLEQLSAERQELTLRKDYLLSWTKLRTATAGLDESALAGLEIRALAPKVLQASLPPAMPSAPQTPAAPAAPPTPPQVKDIIRPDIDRPIGPFKF